jgi:hypothetical protein
VGHSVTAMLLQDCKHHAEDRVALLLLLLTCIKELAGYCRRPGLSRCLRFDSYSTTCWNIKNTSRKKEISQWGLRLQSFRSKPGFGESLKTSLAPRIPPPIFNSYCSSAQQRILYTPALNFNRAHLIPSQNYSNQFLQ